MVIPKRYSGIFEGKHYKSRKGRYSITLEFHLFYPFKLFSKQRLSVCCYCGHFTALNNLPIRNSKLAKRWRPLISPQRVFPVILCKEKPAIDDTSIFLVTLIYVLLVTL